MKRTLYNRYDPRKVISESVGDKMKIGQGRRRRRTPRKKKKKKKRKSRSFAFGRKRLEDVPEKILKANVFGFIDVYSIFLSLALVNTRFNKIAISSTVGRKIQDPQTIESILSRKPCDILLYRLLFYQTLDVHTMSNMNQIFHFAVRNDCINTARYMIKSKIIDPCNNNLAIQTASECGHLRIVQLLLEDERVDPTVRDFYSFRSSWYNGHNKVVKYLLEYYNLKKGHGVGNIPDCIGVMKSKNGTDIVELMDNEDRVRKTKNNQKKKNFAEFLLSRKNDKNEKNSADMRNRKDEEMNKRTTQQTSSSSVLDNISPIKKRRNDRQGKRRFQKRGSRKDQPMSSFSENKSTSQSKLQSRRREYIDRLDKRKQPQKQEEEGEGEGEEKENGGIIDPRSILFDQRLRELENFARDVSLDSDDMNSSSSSFAEKEQLEKELELLRKDSIYMKERIQVLEESVLSASSESSRSPSDELSKKREERVAKEFRKKEKKMFCRRLVLTVFLSWILVFLTFLVLDFYYPVQLYTGFMPN